MAQRGPPCKVNEVLAEGPWAGMTRGEAACDMRLAGAKHRHCAGAAEVDVATIWRWLKEDSRFATAYARAASSGVQSLLRDARESREAADLLGRCHGYHHSVADDVDPGTDRPVDGDALRALLARVAREAPHLLADALEGNREPEGVANK